MFNTAFAIVACTSFAFSEPPAIPLITHDPYFSVWSMSSQLHADWPKHWSGKIMALSGLVRVDGVAYRWCGALPQSATPAVQRKVDVGVTSTAYTFNAGPVELIATFTSPSALATDPVLASMSISALSFNARSTDDKAHDVQIYVDLTGEWCTGSNSQPVTWTRTKASDLDVLSIARSEQSVLQTSGDRVTIDWGRAILAAPRQANTTTAFAPHHASREAFIATGAAAINDDLVSPRAADDNWPVMACAINLGSIHHDARSARMFIAYDESRAIELFERPLRPYWHLTHPGGISEALSAFAAQSDVIIAREQERESNFLTEARRVGGPRYERMLALAYRQVMAGHKIVADWDQTPLMFSKENTSNGCIATVDVIYPASPFFLYHNPELLKAQLKPLLQYASSARWKFPFAPHDLGTYPKANGQVYGGGESSEEWQMPVEESGNMLIMLAALAAVEADAEFSRPWLATLERWAVYLREHGLDPVDQLCTDDFAGRLARNANLSAKTCIALGSYARILRSLGEIERADAWEATARQFATSWITLASGRDKTLLAFGSTDTWSQKYNLIWDRALKLNLFPESVFESEMKWYRGIINAYGLPLDSRRSYTKTDWTVWSACLTSSREDFDAIMKPVYDWSELSPPPSRVPLTDWYDTKSGQTMGMHTRTVIGGMWMPMLLDKLGVPLK